MNAPRKVLLLFVAVMALAGCAGGGDADGAAPVTSTGVDTSVAAPSTAAPSTAPPAPEGPQTDKAKAATLQPADFPPGFQPNDDAPGEGLDIERVWQELTQCLGVDSRAQRMGMATSPTFLRGLATQARATVEYTSEASANAIAAAVSGPRFQTCAKQIFDTDVKRSAPEGAKPGPVAVVQAAAPTAAQRISSYRITATLDLGGLMVPIFQDFVVAFERGAVVRMTFLNPGSEFPQELERSLIEKVLSRV